MKKIFLLPTLLAIGLILQAQTNFSGAYGYSFTPEGDPPATEKNRGPKGNLVLLKGDKFMSIAETEKCIYTEYIPLPGKFIYGWIKKSEIKLLPAE